MEGGQRMGTGERENFRNQRKKKFRFAFATNFSLFMEVFSQVCRSTAQNSLQFLQPLFSLLKTGF